MCNANGEAGKNGIERRKKKYPQQQQKEIQTFLRMCVQYTRCHFQHCIFCLVSVFPFFIFRSANNNFCFSPSFRHFWVISIITTSITFSPFSMGLRWSESIGNFRKEMKYFVSFFVFSFVYFFFAHRNPSAKTDLNILICFVLSVFLWFCFVIAVLVCACVCAMHNCT